MRKKGRVVLIGLAVIIVGAFIWLWPVLRVVMAKGLPKGPEMRTYAGTSIDNLKAIRTALLLYHDNEDRFPYGNGWMDAIEKQLKTNDLTAEQAAKKLRNPETGEYGYALNEAFSGKYKGDVGDDKTVLVFESKGGKKNDSGPPAKGLAITLDGTILQ